MITFYRARTTWKFEYTGDPEPDLESDWKEGPSSDQFGSAGYRQMMTMDGLSAPAHTSMDAPHPPSFLSTVHRIPYNCTTDEVLAAVKAAMFETSIWLLSVDAMESKRSGELDSDLVDRPNGGYRTQRSYTGEADLPAYSRHSAQFEFSAVSLDSRDVINEEEEGQEEYDGDGGDDDGDGNMTPPPPQYEEEESELDTHVGEGGGGDGGAVENSSAYSSVFRHADFPVSPIKNHLTHPTHPTQSRTQLHTQTPDRVTILFRAFVDCENNKAKWLGKNEKLTRLKFQGGVARVLRLKMAWQQFDSLWSRIDTLRSGDLDVKEFRACFGDIQDFNSTEGTLHYVTHG